MKEAVEIVPGTPQWQAWQEYRHANGLTTALMGRCAALGRPWREGAEWPPVTAADQACETKAAASETVQPEDEVEPAAFELCDAGARQRLIDYVLSIEPSWTREFAIAELERMSAMQLQQMTLLAVRRPSATAGNFRSSYDPTDSWWGEPARAPTYDLGGFNDNSGHRRQRSFYD